MHPQSFITYYIILIKKNERHKSKLHDMNSTSNMVKFQLPPSVLLQNVSAV